MGGVGEGIWVFVWVVCGEGRVLLDRERSKVALVAVDPAEWSGRTLLLSVPNSEVIALSSVGLL